MISNEYCYTVPNNTTVGARKIDVNAPLRRISFGDFSVDRNAGELRKHGLKIKLQEQLFRILVMLLERPGDLVTREEVRKKLWPNDTIVEFDHGIGTAINKLRQALGDGAENPRYLRNGENPDEIHVVEIK